MTRTPRLASILLLPPLLLAQGCIIQLGDDERRRRIELEGDDPCTKTVFVSSRIYDGDFGGLAGADAACQRLADDAGLVGTYWAWLADSRSSPERDFVHARVPYVRVDGLRVADDWDDLVDGRLLRPIDLDEHGHPPPRSDFTDCGGTEWAWGAVAPDGTALASGYDCDDWTSTRGPGEWGDYGSTTWWTNACGGGIDTCAGRAPIYCFEQ